MGANSVLRALVYAQGDSRRGLALATFNVGILYLSFPPLVIAFGLNGAGIAYSGTAVIALLAYVRATRAAVTFPWGAVLRITVETAIASVIAALVLGSVGGVIGLFVSGLAYLAIFAALIAVFERSLLVRSRAILAPPEAQVT